MVSFLLVCIKYSLRLYAEQKKEMKKNIASYNYRLSWDTVRVDTCRFNTLAILNYMITETKLILYFEVIIQ